jgi:uncharacterized GH25 family protein
MPSWARNVKYGKKDMDKKFVIPTLLVLAIALISAREFWLQPLKFVYKSGEKLVMSFKAGENFIGEPWDLQKNQIQSLVLQHTSSSSSVLDSIREDGNNNLILTLRAEGSYLLSMQTKNAVNEWEAEKFNSFLKENGLDEILDRRTKTNTLASPAKEYYSGYTKLLVQVGEKKEDTHKKINGFPVEILPLENPYALKIGDPIHFKILFDGKPVFGVRVKVWNRFDNRTTIQNIYTEKNGTLETRVSSPGPWMVSVIRMVPSKQSGADWQSYRGSLVFGINKSL